MKWFHYRVSQMAFRLIVSATFNITIGNGKFTKGGVEKKPKTTKRHTFENKVQKTTM